MHGGYRAGAGRKKGFSGIEAEKARAYIAERVSESLQPIVDKLIEQAQQGDVRAAKELFDRAYGKANQSSEIEVSTAPEVITGMVIHYTQ